MTNIYGLLVGIAMGFLIQRIRASSPAMILRNLRLENLSIIKFMAMTIAVGSMVVYTLALLIPDQMHFDIKPIYLVGVLLGAVVSRDCNNPVAAAATSSGVPIRPIG